MGLFDDLPPAKRHRIGDKSIPPPPTTTTSLFGSLPPASSSSVILKTEDHSVVDGDPVSSISSTPSSETRLVTLSQAMAESDSVLAKPRPLRAGFSPVQTGEFSHKGMRQTLEDVSIMLDDAR